MVPLLQRQHRRVSTLKMGQGMTHCTHTIPSQQGADYGHYSSGLACSCCRFSAYSDRDMPLYQRQGASVRVFICFCGRTNLCRLGSNRLLAVGYPHCFVSISKQAPPVQVRHLSPAQNGWSYGHIAVLLLYDFMRSSTCILEQSKDVQLLLADRLLQANGRLSGRAVDVGLVQVVCWVYTLLTTSLSTTAELEPVGASHLAAWSLACWFSIPSCSLSLDQLTDRSGQDGAPPASLLPLS